MWTNETHKRYFWIAIQEDLEKLINELRDAEQEEGTDLYILNVHMNSREDMSAFNAHEQKEIKQLYKILIRDTKRHSRTLSRIGKLLQKFYKQKEV